MYNICSRDIKKYEAQTIPAVEQKFDAFQADFHISDNNKPCMTGQVNKRISH